MGLNIGFCCWVEGVIINGGKFLIGFLFLKKFVISGLLFDVLFWEVKIVFWL